MHILQQNQRKPKIRLIQTLNYVYQCDRPTFLYPIILQFNELQNSLKIVIISQPLRINIKC